MVDEQKLINYDPNTGIFTWAATLGMRAKAGAVAGSTDRQGYRYIQILGKRIRAHRLAWRITHGEWPECEIDHINGVRDDNRISNLRSVDHKTNSQNHQKARVNNKCGFLGVSWSKKANKWCSKIKSDGKATHIGLFDTPEDAYAAYLEMKRKLHAGCTI